MFDAAFQRMLHQAHLRFQKLQQAVTPSVRDSASAVVFREPVSEQWIQQHRSWKPKGFYRVHCAHDKLRWIPCQQCRRSQSECNKLLRRIERNDFSWL